MLIPETQPCYLTNQSEGCTGADHVPCDPLSHLAFKNPSLKAIWEYRSFEHKLSLLLTWAHVRCLFPLPQPSAHRWLVAHWQADLSLVQ